MSWLPRQTRIPIMLLSIMLVLSMVPDFRAAGDERLEQAGNRAIAAFAVARTLNGVISVIQEAQIGVSLGISTALQPGQILDPLNDLVERFSVAALIAATLLWALKLLGGFLITPWLPLILLALVALGIGLGRCRGCVDVNVLVMRFVRTGIVLWGFAATTPWVINAVHSSGLIQSHYVAATQEMEQAGERLSDLTDIDQPWEINKDRLIEGMRELATMADRLSRQAIVVLGVFVFEVLLVPIAIFWVSGRVLLTPARVEIEQPTDPR